VVARDEALSAPHAASRSPTRATTKETQRPERADLNYRVERPLERQPFTLDAVGRTDDGDGAGNWDAAGTRGDRGEVEA